MAEAREVTSVHSPIDVIEMYLELLKVEKPNYVKSKTYKEISDKLNKRYGINCTEQDIFLLHEPTIDEMETDLKAQYRAMGLSFAI